MDVVIVVVAVNLQLLLQVLVSRWRC